MRKFFLTVAAALGMALTFIGCGEKTGTDSLNNIADTQVEDRADVREENETVPQQNIESISDDNVSESEEETGEQAEMKMNVQIGDYNFTATLENNTAVEELLDMMKEGSVIIQMDDYSGFEKVGSLGRSLTTDNHQTTTSAGDIVLYNGNNIVMFYGSNSWSYTRIGKIDDLTDWKKALGSGSITVIFSLAE
ncbi:MAG: hypothetical protein J1E83_09375 [Lachnospiraceae bacterium]|nr:hypothetical protein [Lachnospiraceae bacterium]